MSEARLLAIKSLLDILRRGKRPKKSLEDIASSLDRRDRSFHMEIVYGVLRFRNTIDWILDHFLKDPSNLDPFTLNNLRIAVYQIFFMRVPDWAVVNEAVEMEKDETLDPVDVGLFGADRIVLEANRVAHLVEEHLLLGFLGELTHRTS